MDAIRKRIILGERQILEGIMEKGGEDEEAIVAEVELAKVSIYEAENLINQIASSPMSPFCCFLCTDIVSSPANIRLRIVRIGSHCSTPFIMIIDR